jgi:hypothetical protein
MIFRGSKRATCTLFSVPPILHAWLFTEEQIPAICEKVGTEFGEDEPCTALGAENKVQDDFL